MRKALVIRLTTALVATLGTVPAAAQTSSEPVKITVEFLTDGRCRVAAAGGEYRAELTYAPQTPAAETGEFRCAVPPVPGGKPVEVAVTLAPGERPTGRGSPVLNWTEADGRWIGTAAALQAPEVIVVQDWNGPGATRTRLIRRGLIGLVLVLLIVGVIAAFRRRAELSRSL
jgi:hypothetical protein